MSQTWFGWILQYLEYFVENIQLFAYRHSNSFDAIFLFVYSLEQAILISLTYLFPDKINLIISFFVILTFLTFGIQKLFLESRNKKLEKEVMRIQGDNDYLIELIEFQNKELNLVYSSYEELMKTKALKTKKLINNIKKGEDNGR